MSNVSIPQSSAGTLKNIRASDAAGAVASSNMAAMCADCPSEPSDALMDSVSSRSDEAEIALSAESTIALTFSPATAASEVANPAAIIAVRCRIPNAMPFPSAVLPAGALSNASSGDIIASYALSNGLP